MNSSYWNWYYHKPLSRIKNSRQLHVWVMTDTHFKVDVDSNPSHPDAVKADKYFYKAHSHMRNFIDLVNEVNDFQPDLVLHLGDIVDRYDADFDYFNRIWNTIAPNIRKERICGNHEVGANRDDEFLYKKFTEVQSREEVAGSKFNQSFVVANGHIRLKVILAETAYDENGRRDTNGPGYFREEAFDWIEYELNENRDTDLVLLATHHGPTLHFVDEQKQRLKNVIDYSCYRDPNLVIYDISGHNHPPSIQYQDYYFPSMPSYHLPAGVGAVGKYTILTFNTRKEMDLEERILQYPYKW
ncbi:metallophosphoesterase family protein [Alkalihalobacterium elongatum]|uniref:metallophosphoesterase family protein n=1 Tax=Alkalihalobacterium elongatum TaxID=2675466 RepID=UPI001C1FD028|nr:metallophosphoesterase [Alkalihalobacterium elongatum]